MLFLFVTRSQTIAAQRVHFEVTGRLFYVVGRSYLLNEPPGEVDHAIGAMT